MPEDLEELKTWLIPGSYGNTSSRKWGREENKLVNTNTGELYRIDIHEKVAFYYWINPGKGNKLNKRQVYDRYCEEIKQMGLEPVSISTMKSYINKKRMFLSLERDGKDYFNDKYAPYIPAKPLEYSGSQWNADYSGTKLGYWVKDKKGTKKVATLQVLRIIDTATGYWLSYAIADKNESQETTLLGFKKALQGLNKTAFELITDNGGSFTGKEISLRLKKLFQKHRTIQLGNKQANPAESFVRRVTEFSREFDNWMALGFAASFKNINNVVNPDDQSGILNSKEEAIAQLEYLRERWNDEKDLKTKKTRKELFNEKQNPKLKELSAENRFFAFSAHTQVSVAECRGIVEVRLNGCEYKYQFADFGKALDTVSKYCTTQDMTVIVAFNAEEAHIYSLEGDYIMALERAKLSHKSFAEMTANSVENLDSHLANKAHFKQSAKEINEQISNTEDLPYMVEVKFNGNGKKTQEQYAEERIEQLVKSPKRKVNDEPEEIDEEEEDINAFINSEIYRNF